MPERKTRYRVQTALTTKPQYKSIISSASDWKFASPYGQIKSSYIEEMSKNFEQIKQPEMFKKLKMKLKSKPRSELKHFDSSISAQQIYLNH